MISELGSMARAQRVGTAGVARRKLAGDHQMGKATTSQPSQSAVAVDIILKRAVHRSGSVKSWPCGVEIAGKKISGGRQRIPQLSGKNNNSMTQQTTCLAQQETKRGQ